MLYVNKDAENVTVIEDEVWTDPEFYYEVSIFKRSEYVVSVR